MEYNIKQGVELRKKTPEESEQFRVNLLRKHLSHAATSPFYRTKFSALGIVPEDITSLNELPSLPLTSRTDLDQNPNGFIAATPKEIVDISLTSGTTGMPVRIPYTKEDLDRLAFNETMAFWGASIRSHDTCLICVTLDRCFIAGLAYYSGLINLGAATIRSGAGQPARQWELIRQLKPTVLVGVPTFLLTIAQWAINHGFNPAEAGIRALVTIGEPIRQANFQQTPLGIRLTETWNATIYSSYGATELETGTCECDVGQGGHIHPELSIVEIVDEQGQLVPEGQSGELVFTPLGVQGFPLVRFRTGDIARLHSSPCSCGYHTPRLGPIEGRTAQRLKLRGTTLYPDSIFHVLQEIEQVKNSYVEVHNGFDLSDEVRVVVGCTAEVDLSEIEKLLQARLRVRPEVVAKDPAEVMKVMTEQGNRKPIRFFDYRKNKQYSNPTVSDSQ
ncbi:MAG: AMP-binding protein [Desulfobulbaceae bacterium]|nr:AMP-binding protein [Desulfobulbaceae bacterium]